MIWPLILGATTGALLADLLNAWLYTTKGRSMPATTPSDHYPPMPDGAPASQFGWDLRRLEHEFRWAIEHADLPGGHLLKQDYNIEQGTIELRDEYRDGEVLATYPVYRVHDINWLRMAEVLELEAEYSGDPNLAAAASIIRDHPDRVAAPRDCDWIYIVLLSGDTLTVHRHLGVLDWPADCTRYIEQARTIAERHGGTIIDGEGDEIS